MLHVGNGKAFQLPDWRTCAQDMEHAVIVSTSLPRGVSMSVSRSFPVLSSKNHRDPPLSTTPVVHLGNTVECLKQ